MRVGCSVAFTCCISMSYFLWPAVGQRTQKDVSKSIGAHTEDMLDSFLAVPAMMNQGFIAQRSTNGFPNGAHNGDLAALQQFFFAEIQSARQGYKTSANVTRFYVDMIYYGNENGLFSGVARGFSTFRPDDNAAAYSGTATSPTSINPYLLRHCVRDGPADGKTGTRANMGIPCILPEGTKYIAKNDNTPFTSGSDFGTIVPCSSLTVGGEASTYDTSASYGSEPGALCGDWKVVDTDAPNYVSTMAAVPRTYFCTNLRGEFSEEDIRNYSSIYNLSFGITKNTNYFPGSGGKANSNSMNNGFKHCTWRNTLASDPWRDDMMCHRGSENIVTAWGTDGFYPQVATIPFYGGYRTRWYDPRYRTWYLAVRREMRPTASPVYTMFTSLQLGFTIGAPVFDYCDVIATAANAPAPVCKPYDDIASGEVQATALAVTASSGGGLRTTDVHGFKVGMQVVFSGNTARHTVKTTPSTTTFTLDGPAPSMTVDTTVKIGRAKIFAGVVAVDYILSAFNQFLKAQFGSLTGIDTKIVYIEERGDAEGPGPMIANSLDASLYGGNNKRRNTLDTDLQDMSKTAGDVTVTPSDKYLPLYQAAVALKQDAYKVDGQDRMLRIALPQRDAKGNRVTRADGSAVMSPFYVQSFLFGRPGIDWRVVVVSPGQKSNGDFLSFAVPETSGLATIVCVIGVLGVVALLGFLVDLLRNRDKDHYQIGDWRFLGLFEFGALLCSCSVFSYIGPGSLDDLGSEAHGSLCLARLWLFNVFFTFTFSALFWKVHRMWRLTAKKMRLIRITNTELGLKIFLTVLVEVVILAIWQGVDPVKPVVNPNLKDGAVPADFVDHIICASKEPTFAIIEIVWKVLLVCGGCFLAFQTRNVEAEYAESKGLMAAMYNVAFIGLVILLLVFLLDGVGENGKTLLKAIGVFWGSVFSVSVIVVPRILGSMTTQRSRKASRRDTWASKPGTTTGMATVAPTSS